MTFEEFLATTELPSTAKQQLPWVLNERTKQKLMRRSDAEAVINAAIDEIDRGSIEGMNDLIMRMIGEFKK